MPLQQILNQINKLLFYGFFGKDAKHVGSFVLIIFFLSLVTFIPLATNASQTNGTISSTYKYAWSSVGGYINFAPTTSTVSVTDIGISGYVWSENDGWINLSPSDGGVTNTVNGVLGGFAWDSLKGWVSFTGVTIDSSGRFHGKAVGVNETISFDCTHCDVRTDWHPISARTTIAAQPVNDGFISGFNTINPLPGARISSTKVIQQGTSTQHSSSSTISSSRTLHNTGLSAHAGNVLLTHSVSTTSGTGNSITQSTTSTAVALAVTPTTTSVLKSAVYVGGGTLFFLIIFFVIRFFL